LKPHVDRHELDRSFSTASDRDVVEFIAGIVSKRMHNLCIMSSYTKYKNTVKPQPYKLVDVKGCCQTAFTI